MKDATGQWQRLQGRAGMTLTDVLRQNMVDIRLECRGTLPLYNINQKPVQPFADFPFCSDCKIDVHEGWNKQLTMHPYEDVMLQSCNDSMISQNTRLGCCVVLEPWMDEMLIEMIPNESSMNMST